MSAAPPATGPVVPRKRRRWPAWLAGAVLAAACAGGVAWWTLQQRVLTPYKGFVEPEVFVEIPTGTSVNAIGRRLVQAGVVRDEITFRLAVWRLDAGRSLKAGEYRFADAATAEDVVTRLTRGDVVLRTITFPEGWTLREMAAAFADKGLGTAAAFLAAARDPEGMRDLDPTAPDLEGYLFPDTYALPRTATAADLVGMMVARFRAQLGEARASAAGMPGGRTVRQLVTLASIVEKETARPEERPVVAGVYANRLRIGMGLQCDPTVIYALVRAGQYRGNLTRDNLQFDSPYNTYRYAGLPPGPIANPGRGALDAALAPAAVDYLYFVSRNDGSHVFAATLDEHNRNVQRYQVQYFREKRARERAAPAASR